MLADSQIPFFAYLCPRHGGELPASFHHFGWGSTTHLQPELQKAELSKNTTTLFRPPRRCCPPLCRCHRPPARHPPPDTVDVVVVVVIAASPLPPSDCRHRTAAITIAIGEPPSNVLSAPLPTYICEHHPPPAYLWIIIAMSGSRSIGGVRQGSKNVSQGPGGGEDIQIPDDR